MLKLLIRRVKAKKQNNGFYPNAVTDGGHLRCPNCDNTNWVIYKYTLIECNLCHRVYNNYGEVGLEDVTPPSHFVFLN